MNIGAKILDKYEQTKSNNTVKGLYTTINWNLSQGCKDFSEYPQISVIHHINKLKNKDH